jgi:hypothetical protein
MNAAFKTEAILTEVYKAYDGKEQRNQLEQDQDTLHRWYAEITKEGKRILDAWRFFDRIQEHIGLDSLKDVLQDHPEYESWFKPILAEVGSRTQVAETRKRIQFLTLPKKLNISLIDLVSRVLLMDVRYRKTVRAWCWLTTIKTKGVSNRDEEKSSDVITLDKLKNALRNKPNFELRFDPILNQLDNITKPPESQKRNQFRKLAEDLRIRLTELVDRVTEMHDIYSPPQKKRKPASPRTFPGSNKP